MWRPVLLLLLLLLGEGEVLPRDMWQEARLLQGACFRKCKEASASASRQGREEEKRESGVCVCVCVLARLLAVDARASKKQSGSGAVSFTEYSKLAGVVSRRAPKFGSGRA